MKMILAIVVVIFSFYSCGPAQQSPMVVIPTTPRIVVAQDKMQVKTEKQKLQPGQAVGIQSSAVAIPVYTPDPTLGYIENKSDKIFLEIWFNPVFKSSKKSQPCDLKLPPRIIIKAEMPLGSHIAYAKGRIKTSYGWQSIGSVSKKIHVDSKMRRNGSFGWKLIFSQRDFKR